GTGRECGDERDSSAKIYGAAFWGCGSREFGDRERSSHCWRRKNRNISIFRAGQQRQRREGERNSGNRRISYPPTRGGGQGKSGEPQRAGRNVEPRKNAKIAKGTVKQRIGAPGMSLSSFSFPTPTLFGAGALAE